MSGEERYSQVGKKMQTLEGKLFRGRKEKKEKERKYFFFTGECLVYK